MLTKETTIFDLLTDMHTTCGPELFREGVTVSDSGVLLYGPYASLPAGKWVVRVAGQVDPAGRCRVDATVAGGHLVLGEATWSEQFCTFRIESAFPLEGLEIRVHAIPGSTVRIDEVRIERWLGANQKRSFSLVDRMGLSLFLDPSSLVDRAIIDLGYWDKDHLDYMIQNALKYARSSRDMVFLDIGSYFGIYSLLMARTHLFDKIVAFEADVLNFRQLCANLLQNDPSCFIEPRFIAVSDRAGEAMFESALFHPDGNRGGVGVNEQGTRTDADKRVVATDAIDNLVPLEGRKIFAKIDVEGHELKVIAGMRQTIAKNKVFLQVETFDQMAELTELMIGMGCSLIHQIGDDYYFTNFG